MRNSVRKIQCNMTAVKKKKSPKESSACVAGHDKGPREESAS